MSSRRRPRPRANGQEAPTYDERQENERVNAALRSGLSDRPAGDTEITANLLREIVETGADNYRDILDNLLAKDYPLANYTGDEREEQKWKFRIYWELFRIIHPNPEFALDVDDQKWAYDDHDAGLDPLTQEELFENFLAMDIADSRVTRGKGMKQQEVNRKSITEARTRTMDQERGNKGVIDRLRRR